MPFGVIYGALFFVLLSISMTLAAIDSTGAAAAARACLALLGLALGWGLLRRQVWARWGGVGVALLLVLLSMASRFPGSPTAGLWILFGSLLTTLLLWIPALGDVRRAAEPTSSRRSNPDRLAALVSIAGAAGFVAALGYGLPPDETAVVSDAVRAPKIASSPLWSDFSQGLERARVEGKPILVNFVTNWCGFCRKMDRTTWKHPTVVERLGEMVAIRVDAEQGRSGEPFSGRDLAARYGVTGYPTIMLLADDGSVISRTGGYQQPRQLLTWLEAGFGGVAQAGSPSGM